MGSENLELLPKVDIIILNMDGMTPPSKKNTSYLPLPACLLSLYKRTVYPFHLIVVDNVSSDGSREWLVKQKKTLPNMTLHLNEELDGGYAAGNNIGLQYSDGDFVLLLNNDIMFSRSGWLETLVGEMAAEKNVGVEGVKLLYPNDLIQHAGVTFAHDPDNKYMVPFHLGRFEPRENWGLKQLLPAVTFACVLIRKELLNDGLDEKYGLGNFEDMDFCVKARHDGWDILYNPEVELYHYEGATQLNRPDQNEWNRHMKRNFLLFQTRWSKWLIEDMKQHPAFYRAGLPANQAIKIF